MTGPRTAQRADELLAALRERTGQTAEELARARGESPSTVRQALVDLKCDGKVRRWRFGNDPWQYEWIDPDARHVLDP